MEANEEKRKSYLEEIKDLPRDKVVHIDESGIEKTDLKDRGWGFKSKKLVGKKSGKRSSRLNIIAGLVNNRPIAPMIFSGSCDTELFNKWVEDMLIKELTPGQTVIMDNVSFHKSRKTIDLIESVGCKVIFLPPYSPDLNPIEKFWANMKKWIKHKSKSTVHSFDTITSFFTCANST
jgi:transposase